MCRQASLLKDPTRTPCYSPFPRRRVRAEECTVRAQALTEPCVSASRSTQKATSHNADGRVCSRSQRRDVTVFSAGSERTLSFSLPGWLSHTLCGRALA